MSVHEINDDDHFQHELSKAGTNLVVAEFTADWCGPCKNIGPGFKQFATKYPMVVFLKVDVDICQETAASQSISAMPTFVIYRNRSEVDRLQGADLQRLESKIKKDCGIVSEGAVSFGTLVTNMCDRLNVYVGNRRSRRQVPAQTNYFEDSDM